eukprot:114871-Ditylum_brightwellii.AAC.1
MPQDNRQAKSVSQTTVHVPQPQPQQPTPTVAPAPAMLPTPMQNALFHNNNVQMMPTQHQMMN